MAEGRESKGTFNIGTVQIFSMIVAVMTLGITVFGDLPQAQRWILIAVCVAVPMLLAWEPVERVFASRGTWHARGRALVMVIVGSLLIGGVAGYGALIAWRSTAEGSSFGAAPTTMIGPIVHPTAVSTSVPASTTSILRSQEDTLTVRRQETLVLIRGRAKDLDSMNDTWEPRGFFDGDVYLNYKGGWIQGWEYRHGAWTEVVRVDSGPPTPQTCAATAKMGVPRYISSADLVVGTRLCVRTGQERWALMKITKRSAGIRPPEITFEVTVWED